VVGESDRRFMAAEERRRAEDNQRREQDGNVLQGLLDVMRQGMEDARRRDERRAQEAREAQDRRNMEFQAMMASFMRYQAPAPSHALPQARPQARQPQVAPPHQARQPQVAPPHQARQPQVAPPQQPSQGHQFGMPHHTQGAPPSTATQSSHYNYQHNDERVFYQM